MVVSKISEDPRSVVFELEVVPSGGSEFVSDAVRRREEERRSLRSARGRTSEERKGRPRERETNMSNENLCRARKSSGVNGRLILA